MASNNDSVELSLIASARCLVDLAVQACYSLDIPNAWAD